MKKTIFSAILRTIRAKIARKRETVRNFLKNYGQEIGGAVMLLVGWGFAWFILWLGC